MINKLGNVNMSNARQKSIHNRKYDSVSSSDALQRRVAEDVKSKLNDLNFHYNASEYDKGMEWFESGLSLEDASDELRKSASFINGFKRGERIKIINEQLYELGREYFENGTLLENIPDNYKENEIFMNGYNDASNERSK